MSTNNSTNRKLYYDKKLQRTSRLTPKIREYLAELANERESGLERFMALSSTTSTASSNVSVGAPSSRCGSRSRSRSSSMGVATTAACAAAKASARKQKECVSSSTVDKQMECVSLAIVQKESKFVASSGNVKEIPIVMENIASVGQRVASVSVEDLCTPSKGTQTQTPIIQNRKTQTPESALKSHKRLEWDPAADVGYRYGRAASTSNISTLERSVLEAAIQPAAGWPGGDRPNHSETDLNRLKQEDKNDQKQEKQQKPAPLASSTFVQGSLINSQSQATPVSTPVATPTYVPSQSSRRESCGTSAVSSFDYQHNSRPSTSQSNSQSCSHSRSRSHSLSAEELLRHVEQQRQEREYAAQLEQALYNRRHTNKEKRENKVSKENKENQQPHQAQQQQQQQKQQQQNKSSSSSTSSSPAKCDLDLGIDLLCSLVNKRSLSYGQKKQLIRDIAKRLACLDLVASSSSSINSRADMKRDQYKDWLLKEQHRGEKSLAGRGDTLRQNYPIRKDVAINTSHRNSLESDARAPTIPDPASRPATASSSALATANTVTSSAHAPVPLAVPVPAPRTRLATPMLSPQPCSYASTSSAPSNELLTQKTNLQFKCTAEATDEQAAVQEWLNPMTQSEIEYEEKRLQRVQLDTERRTQLNWIETEIVRLRTLQNLLTSATKSVPPSISSAKNVHIPIQIEQCNAPTVSNRIMPSDPAVPRSAPLAKSMPTPPFIIVGAAAVPPSAPAPAAPPPPPPPPAPPMRPPRAPATKPRQRSKMDTPSSFSQHSGSTESVCSFVQQRQRQFMAHYQNQQQQRLEQQQQKQQQQLLMRQQQQQQQQVICHQQQLQQQQHYHATCHMHTCPHHRQQSHLQHQPHQQHHCQQQQQQQQQQHNQYMEMQYAQNVGNVYGGPDEGGIYCQVVSPCHAHSGTAIVTTTAPAGEVATRTTTAATSAASTCTTTNSTSSILCVSSEMSIPLSSANAREATTTTTTTTTHQYDDVACHQQHLHQCRRLALRSTSSTSEQQRPQESSEGNQKQYQQLLQERPCGIAYVIHFSSSGDLSDAMPESMSLQDHLQRARPHFCAQSKQRKAILNQMQLLRNARRKELEQLIEYGSIDSLDQRLQQLPPPAVTRLRIFSSREMKAMTSKRCENLPEVIAAQNRECEERRRRSNRILRDVFNRRLQRRVRAGKLSFNHSYCVI